MRPRGGRFSTIGTAARTTFDSLNGFILKGDAAQGLGYLFDALMVRAQDEPDAVYGLVAKSADVADDGKSVTFRMRNTARFADATPVTAADVAFSFALIKEKGHPGLALPLRDVDEPDAVAPLTPEVTASLSPEYSFETAGGGMSVFRLDWSYRGDMWGEPSDLPGRLTDIDSRSIVNFDISYESPDGRWLLALYGYNITDERYVNAKLNVTDYILEIYSNDASEFGIRYVNNFF